MANEGLVSETRRFELPDCIADLSGRIIDVDQHECLPINLWVEEFGAAARPMEDAYRKTLIEMKDRTADDREINADTVFNSKREDAPGTVDTARRLEVMDFIGIERTVIFPGTAGMIAVSLYGSTDRSGFARRLDVPDLRAYGRQLIDAYNDWCLRTSRISDRLRPAAILLGETPEALYADAKRLIDGGIRGLWIPSGTLPGGVAPAHPAHDPLWSLMASARCPIFEHIGGQSGFIVTDGWRKAPAFEGWSLGGEFSMDPWMLTTKHYSAQSFVVAMVIGGVFERHPQLAYGTAELTGHWVGPMAEMMDMWLEHKPFRSTAGARVLTMKPSEYVRRNVRVGCFDFEPIDRYIERFGLEEVYCYLSDYPHSAGGTDPIGVSARKLERLGARTLRRFFADNGKVLLPD
ncbi:MAG TPA: amidohydrolase [Novosphingobium sp.]|nr:amidohydrolase [Novosphingobium sp.]